MKTLLLVVLISCARTAPAPSQRAEHDRSPETPLTVQWLEAERTEHSVSLIARVDRRGPLRVPVKVSIAAADSMRITGGPLQFFIAASDAPSVTDTRYVVSFDATPPEDLVLTADARDAASGVHATDTYRFGRPAPAVATPAANGPRLKVGGIDLGPSTPLK